MDAAAEVFLESGYGNTTMTDVVARAGVTRGACSHHFPTKESLAIALIEHAHDELMAKVAEAAIESASTLENLIRASFARQHFIRNDLKVGIGVALAQAMEQISPSATKAIVEDATFFVASAIRSAIAEGDLNSDVDADKVAYVMWSSMVANNVLAGSAGMSVVEGLTVGWQVNLRGIVRAESEPYFQQVLQRVAAYYGSLSSAP